MAPLSLRNEVKKLRTGSAGWGIGVIVAVLISLALILFGIVSTIDGIAVLFLLNGIWFVVFGVAFTGARDRLYFIGWGLVVAVLSSFAFISWEYALGLEVVVILVVVLLSVFMKPAPKAPSQPAQPATQGP
ncbi:MAG TPA: hypothetical protein VLY21_07575 [Nitrososphaerales archaeon]|nr:hypothetical protein [Nitrososphaerales archaeon]